jgi:hypothetical protein
VGGTIVHAGWGGGGIVLFIVFSYQIKYWIVRVCVCVVQMYAFSADSVYMKPIQSVH